jgi:hypothetical protein
MVTIKLKGREIPLSYMSYEMLEIQQEIGPLDRAINIALGRNPDDENDTDKFGGAEHLKALATLIRILGNAGIEEAGEQYGKPDLTDRWILKAMKPMEISLAGALCMKAVTEGMMSEIPEKEEEGPVDVTLEEMKKKDGAAG